MNMPRGGNFKPPKGNNKIFNYLSTPNRDQPNPQPFDVQECDFQLAKDSIIKPDIISAADLDKSLKTLGENGSIDKKLSFIVNAYNSIVNAVEMNFTNSSKLADVIDENASAAQLADDQLNDDIVELSKDHQKYVESNECDKQEIKLKADIRFYKSQMIIYLKDDNLLKSINDKDAVMTAENIIKEQGLSLNRSYITKAIILSGMKKINNVRKFIKYLYVHFSDSFTSERLISEMIQKNKNSSQRNSPDVIFTQPSSYDINRIKRICIELQSDKSISKVYVGDDSIKVTLNKKNPNDADEKPKKVHVRNYSDLDKLRKDVSAKEAHIATRTFYNKNYWDNKYGTTVQRNSLTKMTKEELKMIQIFQLVLQTASKSIRNIHPMQHRASNQKVRHQVKSTRKISP